MNGNVHLVDLEYGHCVVYGYKTNIKQRNQEKFIKAKGELLDPETRDFKT